jgi:hypothetical protein
MSTRTDAARQPFVANFYRSLRIQKIFLLHRKKEKRFVKQHLIDSTKEAHFGCEKFV